MPAALFDCDVPVLIGINRFEDDLILRLDVDPLARASQTDTIRALRLQHCQDADAAEHALSAAIGEPVEYEFDPSTNTMWFQIDFLEQTLGVKCLEFDSGQAAPTPAEIKNRAVRLGQLYQRCFRDLSALGDRYLALLTKIKKELISDIDRSQRKAEFFRARDREKAARLDGVVEGYQRVLELLDQDRGDGRLTNG